ncbi:DinB family protein [Mongoliitalea daihaiensis]|uniref:DinB family protein n=1 Tax=Mongoliitalea daihaiensis TaxID=2782006 RepID=UPI001F34EC4E|nr:DinB family protein [Mongoliitalea daihaiensis]UJP66043.1 DinB family protein [Mongoliitalea daihaiensis]
MKKTPIIFASLLGAMMLFSAFSASAQTTIEEFVAKWDNGKQFTLDVVDKMPDNLLDYKPHASAMSFNEQVTHLSGAMVMIAKNFLNGSDPSFDPSVKPTTKAELKALVSASYDYVKLTASGLTAAQFAENVEIFGSTASRRQVLALIDDHTTHHRGAAISYIRANGIEPPRFSGM